MSLMFTASRRINDMSTQIHREALGIVRAKHREARHRETGLGDITLPQDIASPWDITMPQDPVTLRDNIRLMTASLLACGLETDNCVLFQQSTVR